MVQLLSPSRVALAILSSPFLLGSVSAMFNATNGDFMSVYTSNGLQPPSEPVGYRLSARTPTYWDAKNARHLAKVAQEAPHWTIYHNRWTLGGPPAVANIEVRATSPSVVPRDNDRISPGLQRIVRSRRSPVSSVPDALAATSLSS